MRGVRGRGEGVECGGNEGDVVMGLEGGGGRWWWGGKAVAWGQVSMGGRRIMGKKR